MAKNKEARADRNAGDHLGCQLRRLLVRVGSPQHEVDRRRADLDEARESFDHRVGRPVTAAGSLSVRFYDPGGRPVWVSALAIVDGVIVAIRSILNPDKLEHVHAR
jgi:hypothetical protein